MLNLTLSSLNDVNATCSALRKIELMEKRQEMVAEIDALQAEVQGHMSMVEDLQLAVESLQSAGFSKEWMSIMNQDNALVAVTNLELPKYFGGDAAKAVACEGAVWDTIKKWIAAVWKWIKELCAKLVKFCSWFVELWVHEHNKKGAAQALATVKSVGAKVLEKAGSYTLEFADPKVIQNYIVKLATFLAIFVDDVKAVTKSFSDDRWTPSSDGLPKLVVAYAGRAAASGNPIDFLESKGLNNAATISHYLTMKMCELLHAAPFIDKRNPLKSWNFEFTSTGAGFNYGNLDDIPKESVVSGTLGFVKEMTTNLELMAGAQFQAQCDSLVLALKSINSGLDNLKNSAEKIKDKCTKTIELNSKIKENNRDLMSGMKSDMDAEDERCSAALKILNANTRTAQVYMNMIGAVAKYTTLLLTKKLNTEQQLNAFMARIVSEAEAAQAQQG